MQIVGFLIAAAHIFLWPNLDEINVLGRKIDCGCTSLPTRHPTITIKFKSLFTSLFCPSSHQDMSRLMRKLPICICKKLREIGAFVFATQVALSFFFLNPKFPAYSHLLFLYSLVYVGPVWKQHCWFPHVAAQMFSISSLLPSLANAVTPLSSKFIALNS